MNDDFGAVADDHPPREADTPQDNFNLAGSGWHPLAEKPGFEGYWTGESWTKRVRSADPVVELERQDDKLQSFGLILSVLLPWTGVGFVLGAILAFRGRRIGVGVSIMLLSIFMSFVWFAAFSGLSSIWVQRWL